MSSYSVTTAAYFDVRGVRAGNPCQTRMRVIRDRVRWRVFELAQEGQTVSRHGDYQFSTWALAMSYAHGCVERDAQQQHDHLTNP